MPTTASRSESDRPESRQPPTSVDKSVIEMIRTYVETGPDHRRAHGDVLEDATIGCEDQRRVVELRRDLCAQSRHSLKGMSGAIGAMHLSALSPTSSAEPGAIDRTAVRRLEDEFHASTTLCAA